VVRVIWVLVALVLLVDAVQALLIIERYEPVRGTLFWFTVVLKSVSSGLGALFIVFMLLGWKWSVWVWACVLLALGIFGVSFGLNFTFLLRWDVALPWVALAIYSAFHSPFARPWHKAA